MHVLRARNVHQALPEAIRHLSLNGVQRESRNGPVLVAPEPVCTVYGRPLEKVEFWALRDANPTFHLMEAMWMLGGRDDVKFPTMFNSKFGQFSDDGEIFNGAYGKRWRGYFRQPGVDWQDHAPLDQLKQVAGALNRNPDDRRQVLAMWDPLHDLGSSSKDVPCNTHAYLERGVFGELNMTVCCRSNDIIWGCYGSNAVHFGFLIEYLAARIGCQVGTYRQISNNWHAYLKTFEPLRELQDFAPRPVEGLYNYSIHDPYLRGDCIPFPLIADGEDPNRFDSDLSMFLDGGPQVGIRSPFLRKVAGPLYRGYMEFLNRENEDRFHRAREAIQECESPDWRMAVDQWLERRYRKHMEKRRTEHDDG